MTQTFEIALLKEGNKKAQLAIYNQYADNMFHVACRLVNNKEDAEEIIQNAFIKVFADIHSLKNPAAFGAWLKQIVIRLCLNHIRKKKPEYIHIESVTLYDSKQEEEVMIPPQRLWQFINELPNGSRTILQLYLVESYKHREIAEMLHISVSTSKSQYQRALALLRQKCEEAHHE